MKTELYKIETLSNLHVGSGDINFNIIDNQVQRDNSAELPVINSSSLKGALREHFSKNENNKTMVNFIFGPDNKDSNSHQTGAYSFFEAQLLTRPVRSSHKAYFNATSPSTIKEFLKKIEDFSIEFDENLKTRLEKFANLSPAKNKPMIFENLSNVTLEDDKAIFEQFDISSIEDFLGRNLALFEESDFKELDLPVIARNCLENGESKNLWYEEIVPKASVFYFIIVKPINIDPKDKEQKIDGFENKFTNISNEIVQIGANKSIGYGFCKITKVSK